MTNKPEDWLKEISNFKTIKQCLHKVAILSGKPEAGYGHHGKKLSHDDHNQLLVCQKLYTTLSRAFYKPEE